MNKEIFVNTQQVNELMKDLTPEALSLLAYMQLNMWGLIVGRYNDTFAEYSEELVEKGYLEFVPEKEIFLIKKPIKCLEVRGAAC
jgi:hypothetical protein